MQLCDALPTHQLQFSAGDLTSLESYTVHDISPLLDSAEWQPFQLRTHGFTFGHSPSLELHVSAMEAAGWRHEDLFQELERAGKAVTAKHTGFPCASAGRSRPFRGLYTNVLTAHGMAGGGGQLRGLPEAERHAIRTVYSTNDEVSSEAHGHLHSDGGDSGSYHLWVPIIHAPVEQWPLVVANATQSQVEGGLGLETFDWHSLRYLFRHRMRMGDYVLLDSSETLHTGASIEGIPTELPRAAVVFDYVCRTSPLP